jgi:hypothetical protein
MQWTDGFTYRRRSEALPAARECLAQFSTEVMRCRTAPYNWFGQIEEQLAGVATASLPYHGDAFVASAAWNTVLAVEIARRERRKILLPVWGLSGQCSALLLACG